MVSFTHFCGPKCSHCCFILSLWAIIMLIILGILFYNHSTALIKDAPDATPSGMETAGKNCIIAAGIYAATALISFWQMKVNYRVAERNNI
eukprot:m.43957 g.43957  ORF g.43957 m.43957 type:complete len:91 (+) comp12278_c0_seq1:130-402(+)